MERVVDFLLDSASPNELRSPFGSTGNELTPALRVNTLPTPSAFGWRTLCVPHTVCWRLEHQHGHRECNAVLRRLEKPHPEVAESSENKGATHLFLKMKDAAMPSQGCLVLSVAAKLHPAKRVSRPG
jgi:hypothetical protein